MRLFETTLLTNLMFFMNMVSLTLRSILIYNAGGFEHKLLLWQTL